jgi:hypothetical protein
MEMRSSCGGEFDDIYGGEKPPLDLEGRRILYIGGRQKHLSVLRRLVEACNGRLVCHDGGVDESMKRLAALCSGADIVVFPVDCVSHGAQDKAKQLCRRWQKRFVPVRRSGCSAFLAALSSTRL